MSDLSENDETAGARRVSRRVWALIALYALIGALLLTWISPVPAPFRLFMGGGLFVAIALFIRLWNVSRSLVALRTLDETGRSPIDDDASDWTVARDLAAGRYASEVREAEDSRLTWLAWSAEYGARVLTLFAALYLVIAAWKVAESGFEALRSSAFREATRIYVFEVLLLAPAFFVYLFVSELLRRRKRTASD